MVTDGTTYDSSWLTDPFKLRQLCWPDIRFYDKQAQVVESVVRDEETVVPAGNMLGKDFIGGFIVVWFFLSRHPVRIVSTSVDAPHLDVLWGEIKRFIQTSRIPLDTRRGGPIQVNHMHLRKVINQDTGEVDGLSYAIGRVAAKGEGLQGHHIADQGDGIARTLFLCDEASGVDQEAYKMADTWARRKLIIGNPWPCDNFFKHAVKGRPGTNDKGGDIQAPDNGHFYRKVIRIKAEDSPNVRLALKEIAAGRKPSKRNVIDGVKPYDVYVKNRALWDPVQQCVSLDADFWEGADELLFPPVWMNAAEARHRQLVRLQVKRKALAIGIDAAEGGDSTVWTWGDRKGLMGWDSIKTEDTNDIPGTTIALGRRLGVPPEHWVFDRGGGGKQHADRLRAKGFNVRTVAFGESATDPKTAMQVLQRMFSKKQSERIDDVEVRYVYKNRRAEMYGLFSQLMDPTYNEYPYAISPEMVELRVQLSVMPKRYDDEGRLMLPPKGSRRKLEDRRLRKTNDPTLYEILGRSPDEADSAVLCTYGIFKRIEKTVVGRKMF